MRSHALPVCQVRLDLASALLYKGESRDFIVKARRPRRNRRDPTLESTSMTFRPSLPVAPPRLTAAFQPRCTRGRIAIHAAALAAIIAGVAVPLSGRLVPF